MEYKGGPRQRRSKTEIKERKEEERGKKRSRTCY